MEGLETVLTRRSIRKYKPDPVEDDKIKNILHAGMSAPSAHNSQPWEFIVVKNNDTLLKLSGLAKYWALLKDAPAAIITLGNLSGYAGTSLDFFIQDCAAATQNMLLAAHAMGLGGVWMGLYPKKNEMNEVRKILRIPDDINPFSIIAIGYPAEMKSNIRQYRETKVFFEKYE